MGASMIRPLMFPAGRPRIDYWVFIPQTAALSVVNSGFRARMGNIQWTKMKNNRVLMQSSLAMPHFDTHWNLGNWNAENLTIQDIKIESR